MKSNYKKLGPYIREVCLKNKNAEIIHLLGVSISKRFMPSIANIIGTDLSTYKIVKKTQFAYGPVTSRNGDKISISLLEERDTAIVSQAYTVFEIIDKNLLDPEYLMMWFRRPEFDRYARFMSHGSVREIFGWEELCYVELPVPSIEEQRAIVTEYNTVLKNIKNNEKIIETLESTANAIYKEWFVDFNFPDENGNPYKSSGGAMVYNPTLEKEIPEGWSDSNLGKCMIINMGQSPESENYNSNGDGIPFFQGRKDFGHRYPNNRIYCTKPKKIAETGDILISVRAPVGDINIAHSRCCIGRGIGSILHSSKSSALTYCILNNLHREFDKYNGEGTVFGSVSKDNIVNIEIPDIPEQLIESIIKILNSIEKIIRKKSLYVQLCQELLSLIFSKMSSLGGYSE